MVRKKLKAIRVPLLARRDFLSYEEPLNIVASSRANKVYQHNSKNAIEKIKNWILSKFHIKNFKNVLKLQSREQAIQTVIFRFPEIVV